MTENSKRLHRGNLLLIKLNGVIIKMQKIN